MPGKPAPIKKSPAKKAVVKAPEPAPEPKPAPVEAPPAETPAEAAPAKAVEGEAAAAAPAEAAPAEATPAAEESAPAAPAEAVVVEEPPKAPTPPPPALPTSTPLNVTVDDVNESSLTIKWQTPETIGDSGLDGYTVEYCKDGSTDWVVANKELIAVNRYCIQNLTAGDLLHVRVVAVNPGGRSEPGTLAGPVPIREIVDRPKVRMPRTLRSRYVKQVGEQINVVIPFLGKPKPVVSWLKDGQPVDSKRVNIRNSDKDSILFIRAAQREDSGVYEMTVKVDSFEDKATITLQIVELPGPPASVKLVDTWGFNAALEWTPPKDNGNTEIIGYTIQKADRKTGEWFTVLDHYHRLTATVSDLIMGNSYAFRVFAENKVGLSEMGTVTKAVATIQKTDIVYTPPEYPEHDFSEAPKFTTPLSNRAATVGYTTKLLCSVRGSPKPKIEWLKNQMIIGDDPKFRQIAQQGICSLEIRKPCSFDGGVYTCRAKNAQGEATVSCKLEVKPEINNSNSCREETVWFTNAFPVLCFISLAELHCIADIQINSVFTCTAQWKMWRFKIFSVIYFLAVCADQDNGNPPTPILNKDPGLNLMYVGETVTFTCKVSVSSGWTYVWYKDGNELTTTEEINRIRLDLSDRGHYSCKAIRGAITTDRSNVMPLNVLEIPVPVLSRGTRWSDVFPTENVKFSCKMQDSLSWTYTWYRDGQVIQPDNTVSFDPDKATLSISSASDSHAGQYMCKGFLSSRSVNSSFSSGLDLTVYDKKPNINLSQDPEYKEMFIGEQVSFTCGIKVSSGWEYEWYRDSTLLTETSNKYLINSVGKTDSGSYTCKAKRGSDKFFHTDSSQAIHLQIEEIPVPVLRRGTRWSDVFPTENVKFSCKMQGSLSWTYTWSRDGQVIQPDNTVSFDPDKATLSISSASDSHAGQYTCKGFLSNRSVNSRFSSGLDLTVYDKKPSVTLTQDPEYKVMFTGEQVSFTCGINVSSGWKYEWYRDSTSLAETSNKYLINSVGKTDSGSYTCKAKRGSGKFFHTDSSPFKDLEFKERPKAIILALTGWSEVFSTDSLVLKCQVEESQDAWNYTWFKAGEPIILQASEKHTATPQNDPEQSAYTCRGIRTGRPSYSEESSSFTTKNLLLKRRLLLSISGCLFFGIIAVFIGCIVLRVIRKPVDDYEKPEEAELFLTMAQLKDRSDTPSPLVAYITDENLKAPSQAGDENDTTCNESAPITSEDQAVTTESLDKEENNAAMVSFKQ
ncbi:hypothetical protein PAMA_021701 [Pampus argenteus]